MYLPEHLWCSSVRSKTQSFHPISVNFVIEILASRNSYLIPMARIFNPWLQNRTLSFWTKRSIVKNLFKKQNISTSHLHNFQCSSEPSKTPSFHHNSVNFVTEILTPLNSHLVSRISFPTASKRMNFSNFASLKHNENKKIFAFKNTDSSYF